MCSVAQIEGHNITYTCEDQDDVSKNGPSECVCAGERGDVGRGWSALTTHTLSISFTEVQQVFHVCSHCKQLV